MEKWSRKVRTFTIREDQDAWLKIQGKKLNLSKLIEEWLHNYIPETEIILVRQRILKSRLAQNEQEMERVDSYGATKV